ncbi:MAG: hypothetical protein FD180_4942 [Planctomycetota bacterium]|nr:MAG: hypothetical protein FD180_4942 [Planctomycetota bacterium]
MAASLPKDPNLWLAPPEGFPPVEERAKNLARHFALILVVLLALAAPVALAWMAGRSAVPAPAPANCDGNSLGN